MYYTCCGLNLILVSVWYFKAGSVLIYSVSAYNNDFETRETDKSQAGFKIKLNQKQF